MNDNKPFDFTSFVSANAGKEVSGFDYLHAVYKSQGVTNDFILWFAKLFSPDFRTVDDTVFITELFDLERYRGLLQDGNTIMQAQFWMNLLGITGLFDELSADEAMFIAEVLATSWNSKMTTEFGSVLVPARAIRDDETGEVFVTIGRPNQ